MWQNTAHDWVHFRCTLPTVHTAYCKLCRRYCTCKVTLVCVSVCPTVSVQSAESHRLKELEQIKSHPASRVGLHTHSHSVPPFIWRGQGVEHTSSQLRRTVLTVISRGLDMCINIFRSDGWQKENPTVLPLLKERSKRKITDKIWRQKWSYAFEEQGSIYALFFLLKPSGSTSFVFSCKKKHMISFASWSKRESKTEQNPYL